MIVFLNIEININKLIVLISLLEQKENSKLYKFSHLVNKNKYYLKLFFVIFCKNGTKHRNRFAFV